VSRSSKAPEIDSRVGGTQVSDAHVFSIAAVLDIANPPLRSCGESQPLLRPPAADGTRGGLGNEDFELAMVELGGYIGRRLVWLVTIIWIAGTINFVIPRLIPGDPVEKAFYAMAHSGGGQRAIDVAAIRESWNKKLGLDEPLPTQYLNYWLTLARGDFGVSVVSFPQPASQKIFAALPWTLGLLSVATLIAFVIGTLSGALLAWPSAARHLRLLSVPFIVFSSIPYYLLAILLIFIFAATLKILPPAGGSSPTTILGWNLKSVVDIGTHAILPALSIVLGAIGGWALGMRSLMVNVLGQDYITYAEAKGLQRRRIFLGYGLRNAILPHVTGLALTLGLIVGGSALVESIFNYPGLGGLLISAIQAKDIFVVNGIVTLLIVMLAIAVFILDLAYPIFDPRIARR
jgi:peptide/nickel transport system permease protein